VRRLTGPGSGQSALTSNGVTEDNRGPRRVTAPSAATHFQGLPQLLLPTLAPIKFENVPSFPVPWLLALFVVPFMAAPPFIFYVAILNRGQWVGHPGNY